MEKKVVWAVVVGLFFSAFVAIAKASPVRVCVTDESGHTKCVQSQPANAMPPNLSADIAKTRAARQEAAALRAQLKELGTEHPKAAEMNARLANMEARLKKMDNELAKMSGRMVGVGEDAKRMLQEKEALLRKSLLLLAGDIKRLQGDVAELEKRTARLEGRRNGLEVGIFGGGAPIYGATAGLMATLSLPVGEATMRLTGGAGISPSVGLGWLGMTTLSWSLFKGILELGPAILGMGDQGDLLSGSKNWLLGAGAELRLRINRHMHIAVTPFLGVTTKTEAAGTGWQEAEYKDTACGQILVKEAGYAGYNESRHLKFTGGALAGLAIPLF